MALSYKEFKGMHKQAWDLPATANSYHQYGLNNGKSEEQLMEYDPEGAKKNFKESLDPFRNAGIGMWNGAGWLGKMEEKAVNAIPAATGAALYTLTEPYYRLKALGSDKSYKQLRDEYYQNSDDVWDDYIPGKLLQGLKYPGQKLQEWNGMVNDYWDRPRDHEDTSAARYNQFFRLAGEQVVPTVAGGAILKGLGAWSKARAAAAAAKTPLLARWANTARDAAKTIPVIGPDVVKAGQAIWKFLHTPAGKVIRGISLGRNAIKAYPYVSAAAGYTSGRIADDAAAARAYMEQQKLRSHTGGAGTTGYWSIDPNDKVPEQLKELPTQQYNQQIYNNYTNPTQQDPYTGSW